MQNSFFQAICRVGIFMICAQAILHFRPQEVYEKYLKLLVSIMVLIQLFLPIGGILLGGNMQAAEVLDEFKREMEQSLRAAEENAASAEAILEQMTLEEVRRRMEEQKRAAGETGEDKETGGDTGTGAGENKDVKAEEAAGETGTEERAGGKAEEGSEREPGDKWKTGNDADWEAGANAADRGWNVEKVEIGVKEVEPINLEKQ